MKTQIKLGKAINNILIMRRNCNLTNFYNRAVEHSNIEIHKYIASKLDRLDRNLYIRIHDEIYGKLYTRS